MHEGHKAPIAMEVKFYLHIMELNGQAYLAWPCVALNGLEWPYVASNGLAAFHGYGQVRPNLTWHCLVWDIFVAFLWSFFAVYLFKREIVQKL